VVVFLISMACDGDVLGVTWIDAMALRSCSMAMAIVVFSWAISCFSESSSILNALGVIDIVSGFALQVLVVVALFAVVVERGDIPSSQSCNQSQLLVVFVEGECCRLLSTRIQLEQGRIVVLRYRHMTDTLLNTPVYRDTAAYERKEGRCQGGLLS